MHVAGGESTGRMQPDRPDALESERTLPVPADDHPLRKRAEENLSARANIDRDLAKELLDAAVRAAESDVLLSLAEEDPVPSSLSDTRAYRLFRIASLLGRTPEPYEVSAIFRVPEATARTITTRMEATYPSLRDRSLEAAVQDTDGPPRLWAPPEGGPNRYEVEYATSRGRDALRTKLRRLGIKDVRQGANPHSLAFPKQTPARENTLDLLGLPRPADE
jgi:hypothetical protein